MFEINSSLRIVITYLYCLNLVTSDGIIWDYPLARQESQIKDRLFNIDIPDPYRWLENQTNSEVQDFWEAQNKFADKYIDSSFSSPLLRKVASDLLQFTNYVLRSDSKKPKQYGNFEYYYDRTLVSGNPILYRRNIDDPDTSEVVVDPNPLAPEQAGNVRFYSVSPNNNTLVYGVSRMGSDWVKMIIVNIANSTMTENESLIWTQDTSIVWDTDGSGFYYSQDTPPQTVTLEDAGLEAEPNEYNKLFYHKLNTDQSNDKLIWEDRLNPETSGSVIFVGEDSNPSNKISLLKIHRSTSDHHQLWQSNNSTSKGWLPIYQDYKGIMDYIHSINSTHHLFYTSRNAPYNKVVITQLLPLFRPIDYIPEIPGLTLLKVKIGKSIIAASYVKEAQYQLLIYSKVDQSKLYQIDLPIGRLVTFDIKLNDTMIELTMSNFISKEIIYKVDLNQKPGPQIQLVKTNSLELMPEDFDADDLVTEVIHYPSKDKTHVPMTIIHKKDIKYDGNNPVYLYGYGGFNLINTPDPKSHWLGMLHSLNMTLAIAHIRGGGENGREWHLDGSNMKRQNSYDDFQYAAKHLVNINMTNPRKIVINGRSNGGTLVGVSITQAPELFGAAVADVGVMDLVRYQKFHDGVGWYEDFGNVERNRTELINTLKFSPLHNVQCNRRYPPTLITSGSHDDRVSPLHSMKFAAKLQSCSGSEPILLKVTKYAGHGQGKPWQMDYTEKLTMLNFIIKALKLS